MNLRCLPARALTAGLMLFVALGVAAQDSTDKKKKEPPDPPRTSVYMNQLRLLFDTWDTDKDGYLDKKELAVAFYGPGTKPFDAAAQAKKDKAEKDKSESKKDEESDKDKTEKDKSTSDKDKDKPKDKEKDKKAPDYSKRADYVFLTQLDVDKDDQISREEFMNWARDYAVQLRDQADALKELKKLQDQLAKLGKNAKNRSSVESKLKKQQQEINKLQSQMVKYAALQKMLK
jgi:hypothetical protein